MQIYKIEPKDSFDDGVFDMTALAHPKPRDSGLSFSIKDGKLFSSETGSQDDLANMKSLQHKVQIHRKNGMLICT